MLETISITCPRCDETTEIGVSRGTTSGVAYSTTSCRRCRARFIALTQEDGRILLLDGDAPLDPTGSTPTEVLGVIEPATGKSGYRVEPPEYLGIFDRGVPPAEPAAGVSDEELRTTVTTSDRILRRADGSARAPAEAAKFVGWRAVWGAQLNDALRTRLAGPPPLSFPPGIFISYRWATPAENDWTAELARKLKTRGYPVVFDRDEPGELDVPGLVSKIADCRYFLAILDSGYTERIGRGDKNDPIKDGWVFDEFNTAAGLSKAKQLRLVGLLRASTDLPRGFRQPVPGTPGNTIDVRTPERLALVLDDVFPPIEDAPDEDTVQRARKLLAASHDHLCAMRFDEAFAAAEELTAVLPGVIDGPAQKVRVALRAGAPDVGLSAAADALELAPRSRELLRAAGTFATAAGQHERAAQYLGLFLEAYGDEDRGDVAGAHHALGSSLDDLDQVYPAIAHLEVARRLTPTDPHVLTTLGFVYRRAGETGKAIERLEEGLGYDSTNGSLLLNLTSALIESGRYADARAPLARLDDAAPGHPQAPGLRRVLAMVSESGVQAERPRLVVTVASPDTGRWVRCSACEARVPLGAKQDVLCGRCGSVVSIKPGPCPYCTSDGRVLVIPGVPQQCPYCRQGQISEGKVGPSEVGAKDAPPPPGP